MCVYLVPLAVDAVGGDGGVGVSATQFDAVILRNLLHLRLNGLNGLPLLIRLRESRLKLLMG